MIGVEEENRVNMEQLKAEVEALQARFGMHEEQQHHAGTYKPTSGHEAILQKVLSAD